MTHAESPRGTGSVDDVAVRAARPGDLEPIRHLLTEAGLPLAGIPEALDQWVVAEATGGALIGVAGLEVHGPDGLLRSVAVRPGWRGRGLGGRLTRAVVTEAREAGLRRLYLLTTTAADWFPRFGFVPSERERASAPIRRSVEFTEACPASAAAFRLDLENAS